MFQPLKSFLVKATCRQQSPQATPIKETIIVIENASLYQDATQLFLHSSVPVIGTRISLLTRGFSLEIKDWIPFS